MELYTTIISGIVYPDKTWEFLLENVKLISPTAFSASIEKLDKDKKDLLKQIRKLNKKLQNTTIT